MFFFSLDDLLDFTVNLGNGVYLVYFTPNYEGYEAHTHQASTWSMVAVGFQHSVHALILSMLLQAMILQYIKKLIQIYKFHV